MENQEPKLTFNFVGSAASKQPTGLAEDLKLRAGFAPAAGDVVSFEGQAGAFLVHSREFKIRASGNADVILNLIEAVPV